MLEHSGHDYEKLLARWKSLTQRIGWKCSLLSEESALPVLVIQNEAAAEARGGGHYLSAGVHGDECAPVWGLLEWAEAHLANMKSSPVVIFPCLNLSLRRCEYRPSTQVSVALRSNISRNRAT